MKKILLIGTLTALTALVLQARTTCSQFQDHKQAQRYFETHKPGYRSLDGDKDGEACECLRGDSSYHKALCKRWRKKHGKQ